MTKMFEALSDRLLELVAPKATASADCGEYSVYCGCYLGWKYYRFCCKTGGCNACYNRYIPC